MRSYLALIKIDVLLASRSREVLFFNYLFPLVFFFIFAEMMGAEQGGAITYVVSMVLVVGILGNGLFGAGMRAVQERENNILRRYKVTPISPLPLLVASIVTGWLIFLPNVVLILFLAHILYGMPVPHNLLSLFGWVSLGVMTFRAIGLILAAVANSSQESQILIQLLYMPMLFLSGATIPIAFLPKWARLISQYLPASYLVTGFQSVFFHRQTLLENGSALTALLLTMVLAVFIAKQIFRWEKGERISAGAKGWVLAVLAPFVLLGTFQAYHQDHLRQQELLYRDLQRSQTLLIRGAKIFVGDGQIIESGGVLIKNGKIEDVYAGAIPDPKILKADLIEASGKTLLPGLIDVHVHLAAPGGIHEKQDNYSVASAMARALAAYLYCGVTCVRSVGDPLDEALRLRSRIANGERLGASLFLCGPVFTAEGGHGTEYFEQLPEIAKNQALAQMVRLPKDPEEARRQVRDLKTQGVDGVKAILETGRTGMLFNRMDVSILQAVAEEARAQHLPMVVHTGDNRDIADALRIGVDDIEHGTFQEPINDDLLVTMARKGIAYDPTLSVAEAVDQLYNGKDDVLNRSLVEQVGPASLIKATRRALGSGQPSPIVAQFRGWRPDLRQGKENLRRAYRAGVRLVTGSDAGNLLVFHGPTVHRELQLWVEAGVPAPAALQAATYNAARLMGADQRIGLLRKGHDADLLLVDGDPTRDIAATERISLVIYKGERVNRSKLFSQE